MSPAGSDSRAAAALSILRAVALRAAIGERLESPGGQAILRSVVDAAAVLMRAEAASIALYDPDSNRLVFRVAAGEHGQGVIGLAVQSGEGVVGYVFASGQPLAIGETTVDQRFQREAAERTGYVPRSLLAVPLADEAGTIGVLEVLDRRDGAPFDLADLETAAVFARQATVAIRATRLERDVTALLRAAILAVSQDGDEGAGLDDAEIDSIVVAALSDLELDGDDAETATRSGLWRLTDAVARVRAAAPDQTALVADILDALARRSEPASGRYRRGGRG